MPDENVPEVKKTLFGMTHTEHLNKAYNWLNENRARLHREDCTVHVPSARCSCGFHSVMTDISAVINDIANPT